MCKTRFGSQGMILNGFKQSFFSKKKLNGTRVALPLHGKSHEKFPYFSNPPWCFVCKVHNVISCKKSQPKHSKNQNRWIYKIIRAVQLRITQNNLKVGSRIRELLIFFRYVCYLLGGTRWIIMFRGFRICTKKLGTESPRPSNGRLKLTFISRSKNLPSAV